MDKKSGDMFDNIAVKLQKAAETFTTINIAISIIAGTVLFIYGCSDFEKLWWLMLLALIVAVAGSVAAWLLGIVLYGFGKLIEDTEALRNKYAKKEIEKENKNTKAKAYSCRNCKKTVYYGDSTCKSCGQHLDWSNI